MNDRNGRTMQNPTNDSTRNIPVELWSFLEKLHQTWKVMESDRKRSYNLVTVRLNPILWGYSATNNGTVEKVPNEKHKYNDKLI